MKGVYLSEDGKKAIEDRVAEIEKSKMILQRAVSTDPSFGEIQRTAYTKYCTEVDTYKEIISSARILPVVESWDDTIPDGTPWEDSLYTLSKEYPKGVIIQPKPTTNAKV
jgi:hypothetical protein